MAEPSGVRVSDDERERAVSEMREHFAAGRLSAGELDDRLERIYRAGTRDELRAIRADLPLLPASPAEARAELVARRADLWRQVIQQTGGAAVLFVVCTAIWLADGAHDGFWPAWVALVVVIPLLRNGWRLYGPAPELDRVEVELARRRRREGRRGGRSRRRELGR